MKVYKVLKYLQMSFIENGTYTYFDLTKDDFFFLYDQFIYTKNLSFKADSEILLKHFYYKHAGEYKWIKDINILNPYLKVPKDKTNTNFSTSYLYTIKSDIDQMIIDKIVQDYTKSWDRDKKINDLLI